MTSLVASIDRLVEIAGLLPRGRAGWSGQGLEYDVFPPSGKCCLYGWAESPEMEVSFTVELTPPGFGRVESVSWEVTAS